MDRDFTALQQVAVDSLLWKAANAAARAVQASWTHSRVAATISRIESSITATPIADRIRAGATTIACAAAAYGAGVAVSPPYVRPGIPIAIILAIAAIAAIVAIGSAGFAKSWLYSSLRAGLRR